MSATATSIKARLAWLESAAGTDAKAAEAREIWDWMKRLEAAGPETCELAQALAERIYGDGPGIDDAETAAMWAELERRLAEVRL